MLQTSMTLEQVYESHRLYNASPSSRRRQMRRDPSGPDHDGFRQSHRSFSDVEDTDSTSESGDSLVENWPAKRRNIASAAEGTLFVGDVVEGETTRVDPSSPVSPPEPPPSPTSAPCRGEEVGTAWSPLPSSNPHMDLSPGGGGSWLEGHDFISEDSESFSILDPRSPDYDLNFQMEWDTQRPHTTSGRMWESDCGRFFP